MNKEIRDVLGLCKKKNRYAHNLTLEDLQNDSQCESASQVTLDKVRRVLDEVQYRLQRGCEAYENKTILHMGPHHDDIMLGIMPLINRQLRSVTNKVYFNIMTSGFHSVADSFMRDALQNLSHLLEADKIQMVHYPDFFTGGYLIKRDKDVHHYLDNVARRDSEECQRGFCHRLFRDMVDIWKFKSIEEAMALLHDELSILEDAMLPCSQNMNVLKGRVREFEEELVWAYMGVPVRNVRHLHLGLYNRKEEPFFPDLESDVQPILEQLRQIGPDVLSVVMDDGDLRPETHFKVLLSVAAAVKLWSEEVDVSHVRILAYRNVWSSFHPADANVYVPVSLNSFAVIEKAFATSYMTQYNAEFPNPDFDGPFSELAEKIWVKQLRDIQLLLGKDFFYQNSSALIRATHGMLFLSDYSVSEFLQIIREKYLPSSPTNQA